MTEFFANQGMLIHAVRHLSPAEALTAIERGAVVVDIRESFEVDMKAFGVGAVIYLAASRLRDAFEQLPRDKPLILADCVGLHSKPAVAFLQEHGFADVANLNGGIADWESAGMPMLADPDQQWTGSCACRLKPRKKYRISG